MDAKVAFGIVLKKVRKEAKISQEQLALDANIERAHISKLERGLFQPSLSTIFAIADVLGCSAGSLVDLAKQELDSAKAK
ncbi:XRE family transcriptional regulator [Thalassotalea euphylliae]|uniref:XRE family transcriptional regulator n=1 Tax=Thalassotalea euphylliae TaxID=1655234 RepID=A0A3E0TVJ3_9GAMM|nr:helix-turn-helix transcriptional regulator [Thalassotalea euphylliae]REL28407.1 XRE family transcriptional regulator [Thalassotalea euphylliae]